MPTRIAIDWPSASRRLCRSTARCIVAAPVERVRRTRVGDHQRVADGLHLGAAGRGDRLPERREVVAAHLVGGGVAHLDACVGGTHEVREQDRDQPRRSHDTPARLGAERTRQSDAPRRASVRSASRTIASMIDETVGSASMTPTT